MRFQNFSTDQRGYCACVAKRSHAVLWMSLGRSFHRIMARGRKLLSVDFLLTTGIGYDDFLKLYILDVDIVSGKRDDKYLGESF